MWKDVKGFEGLYQISDMAEIRRVGTNRLLKLHKSKVGYLSIALCKDGKKHYLWVHRLLAQAFIPNPENKPQVNHINGNKSDCRIENLEWVSISENHIHAYKTGLQDGVKCSKHLRKAIRCVESGVVYESIADAARKIGAFMQNVSKACISGTTCKGLHFEFVGGIKCRVS